MHSIKAVLLVAAALTMTGCATSRSTMVLDVPKASVATTGGQRVFVDEVVDRRVFENEPSEPSIPSLKGRNATSQGDDIKARAVARKRNGYGRALGDILLEGNTTVVDVMRDLLREGFRQAGFHVVDSRSDLGQDGMEVDAQIEKFWAWLTPGFWAVSMESQIETALQVTEADQARTVDVRAYGINRGQTGREGNWVEAYHRGFEDYKAKLDQAF